MLRVATFNLLFFSVLLLGQTVVIEPVVFGIHRTAGGTWLGENRPVSYTGWGLKAKGTYENWQIETALVLTRFFGIGQLPNRFTPEQGFPRGQRATASPVKLDTDYSKVILSYQVGQLTAFVGRFSRNLGPGMWSLMVSEKPPNYPQFGFDWYITDKLHYTFLRGELFSGIVDTLQSNASGHIPGIHGPRRIYSNRFLAAHRLEWDVLPQLTLGFSESMIFGGKGMTIGYLIPFLSLYSVENFYRDQDNIQMSADINLELNSKLRVYAVFLMDELRPEDAFKKNNRNWFAWQGGLEGRSIGKSGDHFIAEATWTDHRIYRHKYPINDFYSHDYPVGHWTGPHAQSLQMSYTLPVRGGFFVRAIYLHAKRGELTAELLVEQYNGRYHTRFSGQTETLQTIELVASRKVFVKLWIELSASRIVWRNPGFDPFRPDQHTPASIEKTSINIGFYYNFDFPGYSITTLLDQ